MKPHLQDGIITVDTDKYRLVGIPPSGREPPDVGLTRIRVIGTRLNLNLLFVAQNTNSRNHS